MRIGVIGTGWGRMHIGAFRAAGADVYALCGADLQKTRRVAAEEGIPFATDDVAALCAVVDGVVVASPDGLHAAHAQRAIQAGRAVLCEKPLTTSVSDAIALVDAARASRVTCATNFPYRMLPPLSALRRWLDARRPRNVVVTVRNGFAAGAAATADFGGASHVIDAALWLCGGGPARWVQATLTGDPHHSVLLHFQSPAGVDVSLSHVACAEPGIYGAWSFVGEGWEAGLSASYVPSRGGWCISTVRALESGGWFDLAPGAEPCEGHPEPWAQAHISTARAFLSAVEGDRHPDLATFREGLHVQEVIEAANRSSAKGVRVLLDRAR